MTLNLSTLALQRRAVTWFAMLALAGAGVWSYLSLGRAEDPGFTIKEMVVTIDWPGASPDEMAREVTDKIERKLQELDHLDNTQSQTRAGHAMIDITLRDDTPTRDVPDLFYQVRKKITDIRATLPDGIQGPYFNDEFGDTYGLVYALTGQGFSLPQLRHLGEDLREQLLAVQGVGKVTLFGQQDEQITLAISYRKLAQLGLTLDSLLQTIQQENDVVADGFVDTAHDRIALRLQPALDGLARLAAMPVQAGGRLLQLSDIADISRSTIDPPASTLRFNGQPALGLGIVMADGGDMPALGQAVAAKIAELRTGMPLGISLAQLNDQAAVVAGDIGDFEQSFLAALGIVLLVSFVSLGWRAGLVVAISVPLVLAGVFVGMKLLGIDLQRISLGAMVIALGLLVDDAIIAVETMAVKLREGWSRSRAGSFAFTSTAFPMLTGTLVTAAGYMPVGLAQSSTGEYTQDIFRVVGLALILSWFVAVLFVPLLGSVLLPESGAPHTLYDSRPYRGFRRLVLICVHRRWWVIGAAGAAFALSAFGFLQVPQQFFPTSDRLEVLIDLRLPEGASFTATQAAVTRMENLLAQQSGIVSYAAYTGIGTPRFFLSFSPELEQPNVAQFVINTASVPARDRLFKTLAGIALLGPSGPFPDIRVRPSLLEFGPPVGYPVQFRLTGPDPTVLRGIAGQVHAAMRASPLIRNLSDNWGPMGKAMTITLDQDKARLLGISGHDVATALQTVQQGRLVTQYREGTDLIPVIARAISGERNDLAAIGDISITGANGRTVPLAQIATLAWGLERPEIWHRNRTPMLLVRSDTMPGIQPAVATDDILPRLGAVRASLPPGYRIETAGAVEESAKGADSINRIMPLMVLVMLALLMLQVQSFSRLLIVLVTAPLGLIGVTAALLLSGAPFGFVAMLGFIALTGIIMRNSVILVDQIEQEIAGGAAPATAIVEATIRRARPILLTASAAILGLIPLAYSVFWGPMALAIIGGLVSATALTLCFVPALYAVMARVGHENAVRHAPARELASYTAAE